MAYEHSDKKPGDLVRSADWNAVGTEVVRLGIDKISRAGEEILEGPLTVRGALYVGTGSAGGGLSVKGDLSVGTQNAGAAVRVLKKQEDGKSATDGALVLGTESSASAALRIGYFGTYSWLQGQGQQAIAINPHGGNVGIGTGAVAPAARLHVNGDALLTGYLYFGNRSTLTPDQGGSLELGGDNGTAGTGTPYIDFHFKDKKEDFNVRLINDGDKRLTLEGSLQVTGNVGIGTGTTAPAAKLHVAGDALVTGTLSFGNVSRQMVNLWGTGYGIGVQSFTTYLRTDRNFAFYKGGSHNDAELNPGGGAALATLGGDGTLQAGAFRFGNNSVLQADQGGSIELGGDNNTPGKGTPYIDFHFQGKQEDYNVRLINNADRRLTLARGDLWLDANQEIFFADNGQIRSADNNHRILFRRTEDKMELREYGSIVFSPGSTTGAETAKATLTAAGQLAVGTTSPHRPLHVEGHEIHSGGGLAGYSFSNRESSFVDAGNAGERWVLYSSNRLARLWTGGDKFTFDAGGTLTCSRVAQTSTREIKRDIAPLDQAYAADLLEGLEPVRYRMIEDPDGPEHLGFVAEEVPDPLAGADHRSIHPGYIVAVLTRVVKEQQRRLNELTHRLEEGLSA